MANNLLKPYTKDFASNYVKIIRYWVKKDEIKEILLKHHLDTELFIKKYAWGVLNYYIEVIEGKSQIGDCPVIQELLYYLKQKNVTSSELFILCSGFKNAMLKISDELNILNYEIQKEINYIFEQNFAGVLDGYTKTLSDIKNRLEKSSSIVDKYVIMSRIDKSGILIDVSEAYCNISGYSKDELIGRPFDILKDSSGSNKYFDSLWKQVSSGGIWQGELKNKKKSGKIFWLDVLISPVLDENNNVIFYESISQNITHRKRIEEQQNIVIEQSKSAAMGEMISMIAHQWRQPLQALSIIVQKLPITKMMDGEISDELLDKVTNDVNTQVEYMSKTIDDFRDFFLPDKPKEEVKIDEVIHKAVDFLDFMFKKETIKVSISSSVDKKINIFVNEIVQVFINILKNARDAFVEKKIENKEINIDCFEENSCIIMKIEDNAGGIPEEIIDNIFDPYFSTKSDKNGTGLGLYMCKTIIEKHSNGKIKVENSNSGCIFIISLPIN